MPQCQFPVFCCFCFQKSTSANILGIGRNKSPIPYFPRSVPEDRRRVDEAQQGAHPIGRRGAHICLRRHVGREPPGSPDVAPSPIYSFVPENPSTESQNSRTDTETPPPSTLTRGVQKFSSGTLPGRGLTPGTFSIDVTASIMLRE